MAQTVADQMVEVLAAAGVQRVYGVVGDSLNGFTDAIRRRGGIEWLHVRHQEVAAFAAGADAHVRGDLAVCAGSCGPGNLHLINGLFDCQRTRVPVVAIAARIVSAEIGSHYFPGDASRAPLPGMFELLRACLELPEQMPRVLGSRGAPVDPGALRERRRHARRRCAATRRSGAGTEACRPGPGGSRHHAVGNVAWRARGIHRFG